MFKQNIFAVVFDLDNTLVSSSLNFKEIKAVINCPEKEDILNFINSLSTDTSTEQKRQAQQVVNDYEMADAIAAKKMPGTDDLLQLLKRLNIPCAIVTRNNKAAARLKTSNNGIDIPLLITREHFPAKPAPDALIYLANYWQIKPENILFVGDYLYDIQMAINANTQSCLLSYGQTLEYAHLATCTADDLVQLSQLIKYVSKATAN